MNTTETALVPVKQSIWSSRTVWVQIIAIIFAVGVQFTWWPAGISQEEVLGIVMALIAAINIVLRLRTTEPIQGIGTRIASKQIDNM